MDSEKKLKANDMKKLHIQRKHSTYIRQLLFITSSHTTTGKIIKTFSFQRALPSIIKKF